MDIKNSKENILNTAEKLRWEVGEDFHDNVMETIYTDAARIADIVVIKDNKKAFHLDRFIDRLVTSKWTGFPIMFLLLALVFWLTVIGTNYPSGLLANILVDFLYPVIRQYVVSFGTPLWITGLLIDGGYLALAWVVSVMLPPMAIFFPMFTILEDFGYLPRVSFNMDSLYRKVGAHGKQALTMSMGFGCNAAGVIAARVIDSPREKLIAIITNNFSLCNGRWPTQILIATIFIGTLVPPEYSGLLSASAVIFVALLGIGLSLLVSLFLSRTMLKGEPSAFSLELPPYRPPKIMQTLYTSLVDRTLFVLWRAMVFAFPAGMVIWLVSNVTIGNNTLAEIFIDWADPFGLFIGLNGVILLAYIIAIPANEIVIPTILMLTIMITGIHNVGEGSGVLFELSDVNETASILKAGGWTALTGINLMLFSLMHNPCSTTIYTIYKETKSLKWTLVSTILPIAMGLTVCFFIAQIWRLLE